MRNILKIKVHPGFLQRLLARQDERCQNIAYWRELNMETGPVFTDFGDRHKWQIEIRDEDELWEMYEVCKITSTNCRLDTLNATRKVMEEIEEFAFCEVIAPDMSVRIKYGWSMSCANDW